MYLSQSFIYKTAAAATGNIKLRAAKVGNGLLNKNDKKKKKKKGLYISYYCAIREAQSLIWTTSIVQYSVNTKMDRSYLPRHRQLKKPKIAKWAGYKAQCL